MARAELTGEAGTSLVLEVHCEVCVCLLVGVCGLWRSNQSVEGFPKSEVIARLISSTLR